MAINYGPIEAINVVREGTDTEAMIDIGKRYPLLVANAFTMEGLLNIIGSIPDYVSARQINKGLAGGAEEKDEEDDQKGAPPKPDKKAKKEEKEEKKPAGKKAKAKKEEPEDDDWEDDSDKDDDEDNDEEDFASMSQAELKAACKKYDCAIEKGMKKSDVIKMLEKAAKKAKAASAKSNKKGKAKKEEEDDDWDV